MFCCESCPYKSNRKYNLAKHIKSIHKRDTNESVMVCKQITSENTQITSENTQITSENTQITSENTQITSENDKKNLSCPKCLKIFKSFHGAKKHESICKGVSNILECHHCRKIFSTQQSKSRHLKICKIKEVKELVANYNQTNNITNNNNTNNNTNNQNLIVHYHNYRGSYNPNAHYDSDKFYNIENVNDFGQEDITYITDDEMMKLALNYDIKGLITQKHFNPDHPENHNIINNCSKSYKVLKNNEWTVETKDTIHSIIYSNSQCKLHDYAFTNLLNKILDEQKTDEYLDKIQKLDDKVKKKRMYDYIDVKVKELMNKIVLSKIANGIEVNETKMITSE
jgi:hypothetical protein